MLPDFSRLSLEPTGEFWALDDARVKELNEGTGDPITFEEFEADRGRQTENATFRVRHRDPKSDGSYEYTYFIANSLWRWVSENRGAKNPLTNEPIWKEDWWALHDRYSSDPEAPAPAWVQKLPPRTGEADVREYETASDAEDEGWESAEEPSDDEEEEEEEFTVFLDNEERAILNAVDPVERHDLRSEAETDLDNLINKHHAHDNNRTGFGHWMRMNELIAAIDKVEQGITDEGKGFLYRILLFDSEDMMETVLRALCLIIKYESNEDLAGHALVLLSRLLAQPSKPFMPKTSSEASINLDVYEKLRASDSALGAYGALSGRVKELRIAFDTEGWLLRDKDRLVGSQYLHPYLAALHVLHYLTYHNYGPVVPTWLLRTGAYVPEIPPSYVQEDRDLLRDLRARVETVAQTVWDLRALEERPVDRFESPDGNGEDGFAAVIARLARQLGFWPNRTYGRREFDPPEGLMKAFRDCRNIPDVEERLEIVKVLYVTTVYAHVLWSNARYHNGYRLDDTFKITTLKLQTVLQLAVETTEPTLQRGGRAAVDTMQAFFWRRVARDPETLIPQDRDARGYSPENPKFTLVVRREYGQTLSTEVNGAALGLAVVTMANAWDRSLHPDDFDPSETAAANARHIERLEWENQVTRAEPEPGDEGLPERADALEFFTRAAPPRQGHGYNLRERR